MYIGILLGVFILAFIFYVHYENLNLEVTHYNIRSNTIPSSFQGVKFVILADLHNNSFGVDNVKLLNEIDRINPEFILITGDMIVGKKNNEYSVVFSLLSKLVISYPIYYGYGNHEQQVMSGGDHYDERFDEFRIDLQKLGVHFLENERIYISREGESIALIGLMIGTEYFKKVNLPRMKTEYLQKLVGIQDDQCYNIMIAHNPVYFQNYIELGADLILSGHLHGGMIRLPGIGGMVSPQYKFLPRYDAGRFEKSGKTMLVSRGLGMHTIKIRVCNRPELMVVTLER